MTTGKTKQEIGQPRQLGDRGRGRMLAQRESRTSDHEITRSAKLGKDQETLVDCRAMLSLRGSAARLMSALQPVSHHGQFWVHRDRPVLLQRDVYQDS